MLESAELKFIAEDTLLVEYGERMNDEVFHKVLALDTALRDSSIASRLETLPSFRSLMIKFDVSAVSYDGLLSVLSAVDTSRVYLSPQRWRVPVCLESNCAQDMAEVAAKLSLSEASIKTRLLAAPLKIYMYGFAPGFAYLGGLDKALSISRRETPRAPMPKGALMIAGGLASLSSVSMPTGWYVLGQTPVSMFSLKRKALVPFAVGDELQLYEVGLDEFAELQASSGLAGAEKIGA